MTATLEKRFFDLFGKVPGTRRRTRYEHSYSLQQEELLGQSPVSPWNNRILSELEFCLQLKAHADADVALPVSAALDILEQALEKEGTLTDTVCEKAETCLLPLEALAKSYCLLLVGHAHLDMNWMWGWDETVAIVVATFKTMLRLMEEYPDFCFSQSQASTYKIIEDYAPELMEPIRQRIREGRWEVTAAAWVETDKNMPSTESLLNHILYTKRYLQTHWGLDPEKLDLDFSPDTFGHSAFLPELDALGNVKYYYHCRGNGNEEHILYRWRAPSGKELLMYREPYWYNSGINPAPAIGLPKTAKLSGGLRTGMAVYGVGDHGGGPTRRDLDRALQMQTWPVFPQLRFGTLHDYFTLAEAYRDRVPVVEGELNPIFTGCYTTQSRIKKGNRRAESALTAAEGLCALASSQLGLPYPEEALEKAWQKVLLTHFHDIITGSCKQDSREYAMGLYQEAMSVAGTRSAAALEAFAAQIDTSAIAIREEKSWQQSEGAGVGFGLDLGNIPTHENQQGLTRIFHIFNTTGTDREEAALLTVWDWPGAMDLMHWTDDRGQAVAFSRVEEQKTYWAHQYFQVRVAVKVPAWGYATLVLSQADPIEVTNTFYFTYPRDRLHHGFTAPVLENEYLRARFDHRTGALVSLTDKETGTQLLAAPGGLRYVRSQRNDMSAWVIDRWLEEEPVNRLMRYETADDGLCATVTTEHEIHSSRVTTSVSLGKYDRALKIAMKIDWLEEAAATPDQPLLVYALPLAQNSESLLCDVPGGAVTRAATELDLPCLRYGAAVLPDDRVLAAVCDCKYGFRLSGQTLSVTLINTAYNPDPYPERGIQEVALYLLPGKADPAWLAQQADICLNPLQYITGTTHSGTLPTVGQLLKLEGETAVFTGVAHRNGGLAVRMYEAQGKECPVRVVLNAPVAGATATDLFGQPLVLPVFQAGNEVSLTLPPYTTVQLLIHT